MKKVGFLIQGDLQVNLALWAISIRPYDKYFIFCRKDAQEVFEDLPNVILVDKEEDVYKQNPDIVFSLGYWKIIDKKYTDKFRIINLHHSYNLAYRGRHMCSWAIINARKYDMWTHGTTIHAIDERLDCGQIIYSWPCPIYESDTAYSLFCRCNHLAERMWKDNYIAMLQGKYTTKTLPPGKFNYRERDLVHEVDLNMPAIDIYDRVRALTFPGKRVPYAVVNGHVIELAWKEGDAK